MLFRKMPQSQEILLNNLMVLKSDGDKDISNGVAKILLKYSDHIKIGYQEIFETAMTALTQLRGNDESNCVATLAKLSSFLSHVQLNYFELKEILEIIFSLLSESHVIQQSIEYNPTKKNSASTISSNICKQILSFGDPIDVVEIIESKFTSFDGDVKNNFLGCVLCLNEILRHSLLSGDCSNKHWTVFEVLQMSHQYITLLNIESTEIVLNVLETEAPKTQSTFDVRKASMIDGLGLMAKMFPDDILPVVLYTIVENAGSTGSPILSEAALYNLKFISEPKSLEGFLQDKLSTVMNELNVRILNMTLNPNSPNALIFLAKYFDFSQAVLLNLVDQLFSRSCDPFCGGHLQYLYSKVFYSFILSLWSKKQKCDKGIETEKLSSFLSHRKQKESTCLEFIEYLEKSRLSLNDMEVGEPEDSVPENKAQDEDQEDISKFPDAEIPPSPEINLTNKICYRVLNFLPNSDRNVRLLAMDCLIKGIDVLRHSEDLHLPLSHVIWQNLVPR